MANLANLSTQDYTKSFWKRTEGKVSMLVLPLLLVGLGLSVWVWLLPIIFALLANTLAVIGMALLVVFIIMAVADPNARAAVEFLFKRGMFKLTDALYKIDPVGVLRIAVSNMVDRVKAMKELKDQLKQHIQLLQRTIASNTMASQQSASIANRDGTNKYDKFVESRQAARLTQSNLDYEAALTQLRGIDNCLDTYIKVTTALAKDSNYEADNLETSRNNLLKTHRLVRDAAKNLQGHEEAMNQFNRGAQIIANERVTLLSEVDAFAQLITDTVGAIDIQAGIVGTNTQDVQTWQSNANVLEKKVDLLLGVGQPSELKPQLGTGDKTPVQVSGRKTYSELFGNK